MAHVKFYLLSKIIYQKILHKFLYCAWHLLLSTVLFVYYIVPKHSVRILKNRLINLKKKNT